MKKLFSHKNILPYFFLFKKSRFVPLTSEVFQAAHYILIDNSEAFKQVILMNNKSEKLTLSALFQTKEKIHSNINTVLTKLIKILLWKFYLNYLLSQDSYALKSRPHFCRTLPPLIAKMNFQLKCHKFIRQEIIFLIYWWQFPTKMEAQLKSVRILVLMLYSYTRNVIINITIVLNI